MSGANGFVETTERLIQLGASVKATDKRGYTPALACAPNDNVATCLATILMEELKLTDVDVRTSLCSLGKIFTLFFLLKIACLPKDHCYNHLSRCRVFPLF